MTPDLNLNLLDSFVTLADTLSFVAAAKRLHTTQPSVSRHIRELESQLGVPLFFRNRHEVRLSPQGSALLASVRPLLAELRAALENTSTASRSLSGDIRVSCLAEVGQSVFMPRFLAFREAHASVRLIVSFATGEAITDSVRGGAAHFGIVSAPMNAEGYASFALITETFVVVTRRSNRHDIDDIARPAFVAYREDDPVLTRYLRSATARAVAKNHQVVVMVNSHRSMLDALASDDLYAVLPLATAQPGIDDGSLRLASSWRAESRLYLICRDANLAEARHRAFKSFVVKLARKEL